MVHDVTVAILIDLGPRVFQMSVFRETGFRPGLFKDAPYGDAGTFARDQRGTQAIVGERKGEEVDPRCRGVDPTGQGLRWVVLRGKVRLDRRSPDGDLGVWNDL